MDLCSMRLISMNLYQLGEENYWAIDGRCGKMTEEQINVAIAQACGWTEINNHPDWGWLGRPPNWIGKAWPILDYCNDLNAMHEAENEIIKNHNLWTNYFYYVGATIALHATARQRAEAFLRTIGKWEEVQA